MNIFNKITQFSSLTESETTLTSFIENHTDEFLSMNAEEIANECFISVSTIYRLCNKLKVTGLTELKILVSASIKDHLKEGETIDFDFPVKQYETQYQISHHLKELFEKSIQSTLNLFDYDEIRRICTLMYKCQHIDIYTSAGNIFFAQNFQFQLKKIGVHASVPIEEYSQRLSASCSTEQNLAIVISFGGRGHSIEEICKILRKNKTPIILIGAGDQHPLEKYAIHRLYLCHYENHYNKISSFSSRLSLLYILDILYTCYFSLNYDQNIEKKINYYKKMASI